MQTLNIALARNANGSVDLDGTLEACRGAVLKFVAERETELATVSAAVEATFDSLNGAKANMPYVIGQTLRTLNVQPENYKALEKRVAEYIRENAGDRASGALFNIGKGKGGGVLRHSDQPEPEAKKA